MTTVANDPHIRSKVIPLSAAMFVLGAALLALASRAFAGKGNTRGALVQVVVAQALIVIAAHFGMRDLRNAEFDWDIERRLAEQQKKTLTPGQYYQAGAVLKSLSTVTTGWLIVRTCASALIVVALTRSRARAFFDDTPTRAISSR
jgi:hypothetical protein